MRIGIGIGLQFNKSAGGNSAEALAWKARIEANGGTISQALLDIFDTNFFIPAKANGNILTELDRLNIYCGLVGFEIAARTNLIKSDHYVTPVSSPTFDNNGYKSSGTSYLDLNYNLSIQSVKLTSTSSCQFIIVKTPAFASVVRRMGGGSASSAEMLIGVGFLNAYNTNPSGLVNPNITSIGNVFLAGKRDGINIESQINSNVISSTSVSAGLPNVKMFELTNANALNNPSGNYDADYHLCSGHGSYNLDTAALRTILNNLFTALGV